MWLLGILGRFAAGGVATLAGVCSMILAGMAFELATDGHSSFPLDLASLVEIAVVFALPGSLVFIVIDWCLKISDRVSVVAYVAVAGIVAASIGTIAVLASTDETGDPLVHHLQDLLGLLVLAGEFAFNGAVAGLVFWLLAVRSYRAPFWSDVF